MMMQNGEFATDAGEVVLYWPKIEYGWFVVCGFVDHYREHPAMSGFRAFQVCDAGEFWAVFYRRSRKS